MKSHLTREFRHLFDRIPPRVQQLARNSYKIWKQNPKHPGLHFRRVHPSRPIYSIRIGLAWRALSIRHGDDVIWFWIGSHSEYDRMLKQLRRR